MTGYAVASWICHGKDKQSLAGDAAYQGRIVSQSDELAFQILSLIGIPLPIWEGYLLAAQQK